MDTYVEDQLDEALREKKQTKDSGIPFHIFYYHRSDELDHNIEVVISQLRLPRVRQPLDSATVNQITDADCRVSAQIFCNGFALHGVVTTRQIPRVSKRKTSVSWEEPLVFPIKYKDLSGDAILVLTLIDSDNVALGGATMRFFERESCRMVQGLQHLLVFRDEPGDSSIMRNAELQRDNTNSSDYLFRLEKIRRSLHTGRTGLDMASRMYTNKALAELSRLNHDGINNGITYAASSMAEADMLSNCILDVEVAGLNVPVIFEEKLYHSMEQFTDESILESFADPTIAGHGMARASLRTEALVSSSGAEAINSYGWANAFVRDWEVDEEGSLHSNLAEGKHHKMHQTEKRGTPLPDLKPTNAQKVQIDQIVQSPSDKLTVDEQNLLWQFQHSLTGYPAAIVKFVKSVRWEDDEEKQLANLTLQKWDPPDGRKDELIDIADALRLLSKDFHESIVRKFAVQRLHKANDDELNAYLLQLVAALRYEPPNPSQEILAPLAEFLIDRACKAEAPYELANFLYWYLKVEIDAVEVRRMNPIKNPPLKNDEANGKMFQSVLEGLKKQLAENASDVNDALKNQTSTFEMISDYQYKAKVTRGDRDAKLEFLKAKLGAMVDFPMTVSSPLNPRVQLVKVKAKEAHMFKSALYPAKIVFERVPQIDDEVNERARDESLQDDEKKKKKSDIAVRKLLGDLDAKVADQKNLRRKSDKNKNIVDIYNEAKKKEKDERDRILRTYSIMLKNGDDVRQDQLVMQLIRIMDNKLKETGLNLEFVPYGILATAAESGLLEFVSGSDGSPSWTMTDVLDKHKSVFEFLKAYNPDSSTDNKISVQCMNNFVRSCAGYAVVTFVLGVGDRHLDNVMMLTDGHFLHIDFGWIFGEDPKKNIFTPPPFRFHKSLLDAMGGKDGENFLKFCQLAKAAYIHLRHHARLFLSLCQLMVDSGIDAFVVVGSRKKPEDLLKVMEDRFRLAETEERAGIFFDAIIEESVNHVGVEVLERFHKVAVSFR